MAALEFRILNQFIADGSLQEAIRLGIRREHFRDAEARQIWDFLTRHWYDRATAKTLPPFSAIERRWPSFQRTALTGEIDPITGKETPLSALLKEFKSLSFESDIRSLAAYFQELVDENPQEAIQAMQKALTEMVRTYKEGTEHIGLNEVVDEALAHYEAAQTGVVFGIPWPWECLTLDTLGKRPGDFIVFYARMKQMKTWVMLYCAVYDYLHHNSRVLIWSREMSKQKMALRIASLIAEVDYQLFKKGKLPKAKYEQCLRAFAALKQEDYLNTVSEEQIAEDKRLGKRQLLLLCGRDAPKQLKTVQAIIQRYGPDIVYLDSFYHMESDRKLSTQRWQRIAELAEDVKSMAEDEAVPVIAVHQANRFGEKTHGNTMADLSDSDVIAREADLVIRVIKRRSRELYESDYEVEMEREAREKAAEPPKPRRRIVLRGKPKPKEEEEDISKIDDEEEDKELEDDKRLGAELALVLPGNRDGVLDAFTINAIPGYNFSFISSKYTLDDIEEWLKADDGNKSPKGASGKAVVKPQFSSNSFRNFKVKEE
jgi:replicative DNA helicase